MPIAVNSHPTPFSDYWKLPSHTGVAQRAGHCSKSERSPDQFMVKACAQVAGQVPSWGHLRGQLSLSPSLSYLKINKIFKKKVTQVFNRILSRNHLIISLCTPPQLTWKY